MNDIEHPGISKINRTGETTLHSQPEHWGSDYFGDEIFFGDEIVEIHEEIVLKENLERFLAEVLGLSFKTAL
ncbi:YqaI family protein [Heyndrickxia camelliae]|uniref:YqaI family protein n=1 Tax=Heyndrickxia camelliae TaxID=1707093 RepID=UPI001E542733|nr:hypothetical protein [Heyndrickxia camelliae]